MSNLTYLGGAFRWILQTTWQAAVLAALILLAQRLLRKRLSPAWRYGLWLLLVARLLIPVPPKSAVSVFNLTPQTPAIPIATASPPAKPFVARSSIVVPDPRESFPQNYPVMTEPTETGRLARPIAPATPVATVDWLRVAFYVWLAGVVFFGARLIWTNLRFRSRIGGYEPVADESATQLFAECRAAFRITKQVRLIESEEVESPAVYGLWRKWLLLPDGIFERFSTEELRCIFLHELAHIKRGDLVINWLVSILQIFHWFNPILWLAWARMRADRELATDALALALMRESDHTPYGETILKVLEGLTGERALPGLVGIVENKALLKERLAAISRPAKSWKWLALAAAALIAGLGLTGAQTDKSKSEPAAEGKTAKPDLTGDVRLTNGEPVMATVFISTAGPKTGTSTLCPSCYADCIKSAKADANGHFKIESLDPALLFRILIVAKGCEPQYVAKVDPAQGPVEVKLKLRNNADASPGNTLHGRIVDAKGVAVVGAAVEALGIHARDGTGRGGSLPGVDPLAVTDEDGEFLLTSRDPFATMDVKVEARTFARKTFTDLSSGAGRHDLVITEGATVSGRLIWKGKPLPGIAVGIVSADRTPERFTGNYEVGTDANGRFSFVNLPPNVEYVLYGIMHSLTNYGATLPAHVSTGGDGSDIDAGDLVVGPAHRLAGRVVLDDGAPISADTRLLVGLRDAWDTLQIDLDRDGHFETTSIPASFVNLSVRVPGYRVSGKNASLDPMNPYELSGRVDGDITNLILLMEKGPNLTPDYNSRDPNWEKRPLRGAEGGVSQADAPTESWRISGRLTDAKTGNPVARFQITPGTSERLTSSFPPRDRVDGGNGVFALALSKRVAHPFLKIEADGYLPVAVPLPMKDITNFDLTLQPGSGPAGVVMLADGKPAAKVTVGLVCADQQELIIRDAMIAAKRDPKLLRTTDANGQFAFAPELGMEYVAAASPDGFKLVSLATITANPKMILEPWGRITGTLTHPSGPGTNEDLDIKFSKDEMDAVWSLQTGGHAVTDEKGNFEFERVPPGKLELTCRLKSGSGRGWADVPLKSVTLAPGETLKLDLNAPTPRAPTVVTEPASPKMLGTIINGTVTFPDGTAAAGAQISLIAPNLHFSLGKAEFKGHTGIWQTTADSAGHFRLTAVEGLRGIVAVDKRGFARIEQPGTNAPTLVLQPWGEIHGTLRIGNRLGTNQSVSLQPKDFTGGLDYDSTEFTAQTDDQARFVITYAPPGEQRLARHISYGNGLTSWGSGSDVVVKAGGVTELTIGGTGREILGKTQLRDIPPAFDWKDVNITLGTPRPKGGWNADAYRKLTPHAYVPDAVTNGEFRFEDIPPGRYALSITWHPNRRQHVPGTGPNAGIKTLYDQEIAIPDEGAGANGKPFDLGNLELRRIFTLFSMASPLEAKASDGRKIHLADYLGKYVLLTAFNPADGNAGDLPQLSAVFDAFGKDDRFTMLGVSYSPGKTLEEFAHANGIAWPLGSLGELGGAPDHTGFREYFDSAPDRLQKQHIFLIDPKGKIIAKDLHGGEINKAVTEALAGKLEPHIPNSK